MKCSKETKKIGDYELVKTIGETRGIVRWTGEGNIFFGLSAHLVFNRWTDELFKIFMPADTKQEYMDAWETVVKEMDVGKSVETKVIDKDGFILCIMHQDENQTWIKFYKKEG